MYYYYARNENGDRFLVPFLLGGLAGGALVGVSRPRPVYVNSTQPYYNSYPYPNYYYNNSYYGYY